jgi:Ca2+-binding RTX toxin-like protein
MNANGTGVTKVTGSGAEEAQPTWSPDGTTIAYARCTAGCSIWSIHVDGTNATRLTYGGTIDSFPAWSPLGGRIAFRRPSRLGNCIALRTVRPDGTDNTSLTPCQNGRFDQMAAWSPDGRLIAFTSFVSGVGRLTLIRPDGSHRHIIGRGLDPGWAPDGQKLVFTGALARIRVPVRTSGPSGGDVIEISEKGVTPAWQPLACTLTGTSGDDDLVGTPGDDVICAGAGNDTVDGAGGNDVLSGGPGRDTTSYASSASPIVVRLPLHATGRGLELLSGFEDVIGSPLADVIAGGGSTNSLFGGGGADHLFGLGGADQLLGSSGEDTIRGGAGSDTLRGGSGNDTLDGRDGAPGDFLSGGSGNDTCLRDPGDIAILC